MQEVVFPTTAGHLGRLFDASILGDPGLEVSTLSSLENARPGSLTFYSDKRYSSHLEKLKDVVLLTSEELIPKDLPLTAIFVPNPKRAFAEIAKQFVGKAPWTGISKQALIAPTAKISETAHIGPFVTICDGTEIGSGVVIYPYTYIGPGVKIGKDTEIHPHVTLLSNIVVGERTKIFSGTVIGSDGFGFLESDQTYSAMPQLGGVIIGNDVRIGANVTIDRSTLGVTSIGDGTKMDDHVHIGHNCRVGKNCILCACVALGGSTVLEDDVILAGQVGTAGHMTIGKGARLGGQSGAGTDLQAGETYLGSPVMPIRESLLAWKYSRQLPSLVKRLRKLEEKIGTNE